MLAGRQAHLTQKSIVLASSSPRRKELLESYLGLRCEVLPSGVEEDLDKIRRTASEYCEATARRKAAAVAARRWHADLVIG